MFVNLFRLKIICEFCGYNRQENLEIALFTSNAATEIPDILNARPTSK